MKKIIGIFLLIGGASIGWVFANDCNTVVGWGIDSQVSIYKEEYKKILPVEWFRQALTNLKAYCCSEPDLMRCTNEEKNNLPNTYYPESEFLFDHLLDITMRRLDGITGLAYNLAPDPTGLERRTKITKIANSATGVQAKEIEKIYTGYRTISWSKSADVIKKQYNNTGIVSLGEKYNTLCGFISKMYDDVPNTNKTLISKKFMNNCNNIIKDKIRREVGYTQILMVQKSNQLLDEGTKAYTKKYFVQEKLMALWNLITKVKDMFQTIVQQAPASKICSQ